MKTRVTITRHYFDGRNGSSERVRDITFPTAHDAAEYVEDKLHNLPEGHVIEVRVIRD